MEIFPIPGFSEPFSSISHLIGCALAFYGAYSLFKRGRGNTARQISLLIFSFGLIFQFSMSGVYHLLKPGLTPRYVLQVLDHAAIFVLIAGTFTPIHIILFRRFLRWGIIGLVWTVAITGIVLTSVFFDTIPEWMNLSFYIGLGWVGAITFWYLLRNYGYKNNVAIILGGLAYTSGAVLEFLRWPIVIPGVLGPHEIFHILVLVGAFCHWKFIYGFANAPISAEFIIKVIENQDGFYAYSDTESVTFKSNSLSDIKIQVSSWVEESYHISMKPEKINLQLTKEEYI